MFFVITFKHDKVYLPGHESGYVTFTAEEAGSTIGLAKLGSSHTLEYSTDGQSWTPMTTATSVTLPNVNDKVYVRGILLADQTNVDYTQFKMTGKIAASGNCNALWNYENLEAPLKEYCGFDMFADCTSLTQAPELPATILAACCYYAMFRGCTILTQPTSLPATTLEYSCYGWMFCNCKLITTAPQLPAMTLSEGCYENMFSGCESLIQAPSLPATILAEGCYDSMFSACVNLTTAPDLPATRLVSNCYKGMFFGCSNLSSIKCLATTNVKADFLVWWTRDISQSGTFTKAAGVEWPEGASGIPHHWVVKIDGQYTITFANWDGTVLQTISVEKGQTPVYTSETPTRPSDGQYNYTFNGWTPAITEATQDVTYTAQYTATAIPIGQYVTFTAEEAGSTIGLAKLGSAHTLEYSTDTQSWTQMTTATSIALQNVNDKVYVRGVLNDSQSNSDYTQFTMTGKIAATGKCNTLWNYEYLTASLNAYCGYQMFYNCTSLTTAPELPTTILARYCYCGMFIGCTSLKQAPTLPAIALTMSCYWRMFEGCTSLTTAPELPATTLGLWCYYSMFDGCTSLTTAPELPATTLTVNCYCSMFNGCTGLTTAPELPATTLVDNCYMYMFQGCTSLSTIKCLATDISATGALTDWTNEVASSGTFTKAAGVEWPEGASGIPHHWVVKIDGQYTITFANWDGTVLQTIQVEEGQTPVYTGETPTRPSNDQYKYTFNGWTPTITIATQDVTYIAQYIEEIIEEPSSGVPQYLRFGCSDESGSATIKVPLVSIPYNLQYRVITDNIVGEWKSLITETRYSVSNNQYMEFRGNNPTGINRNSEYMQFITSGNAFISGNIMSLCDNGDHDNILTLNDYAFYYMFGYASSGTLDASGLHLPYCSGVYCYGNLFRGNTALTVAPKELPATTLTKQCYQGMFYNCSNLVTGPEVIAATTVDDQSFRILFSGCSKLTTTPRFEIKVLEGTNNCYNMFYNCTSLTDINCTLSAATLTNYCYRGMFSGCRQITHAPELPATTLVANCYYNLFNKCSKLSSITCLATNPTEISNALTGWTTSVASSGTFYKAAGVEWPTSTKGIPEGWTVVEV